MKKSLAAITIISFSFAFGSNLAAQQRSPQRTQVVAAGRTDLNSTLVDLDRVAQATQNDITNLHVEKWKAGWKTGFLKDSSHKDQAAQAARSVQRNLASALPGLIHDVQASRGGLSATFKLYDDVSLVCEAVDSVISASENSGKKTDAASLVDDYSALSRVRRSLSNYIQQVSTSLETRGTRPSYASVSAPVTQPASQIASSAPQIITDNQGVKKIIIDDTVPEKKAAAPARKKPVTLTNLE